MVEYLISVIVMSSAVGFLCYAAYPSSSERVTGFAASILLLYTLLNPVASFISEVGKNGFDYILGDTGAWCPGNDLAYSEVAEDAFKEGVCKLLFTKFGIDEDRMCIEVEKFDFETMKCEKIKIVLLGSDVFSNWRAIRDYVTESGLGECEVCIDFG